jgi:hypothetical protein
MGMRHEPEILERRQKIFMYRSRGEIMAEPVMEPVIAILAGAVLVGSSLITAAVLAPGIRMILGIAGVVTLLVGIIMLFGIARGKE